MEWSGGTKIRIPGHKGCNDVDGVVGWFYKKVPNNEKSRELSLYSQNNKFFNNFDPHWIFMLVN